MLFGRATYSRQYHNQNKYVPIFLTVKFKMGGAEDKNAILIVIGSFTKSVLFTEYIIFIINGTGVYKLLPCSFKLNVL